MKSLNEIISFACTAHKNQFDKQDKPYILHPLTVMLHMDTIEEMIVAILHDVIEDTEFILDEIEDILKLNHEIVLALDAITKRKK